MRPIKQLSIDFFGPKVNKARRYFELSINEKINVKANSCGFQVVWLKSALPWNRKSGIGIVSFSHKPEQLTQRWFLYHKINKNRTPRNTMTLNLF